MSCGEKLEEHSIEMNQNSILRMTDEKTIKLIELYKREQCLWNTKLEAYKNKEMRAYSAAVIARNLDLPHFEARHVMIKFKNLRNSYCQELKKIERFASKGVVYKPTVVWFPLMDSFLRPHLQPAKHQERRQQLANLHEKMKEEPDKEWLIHLSNPDDVFLPENSYDSTQYSVEEEDISTKKNDKNPLSNLKRKLERSDTDNEEEIAKSLKEISQTIQNNKQTDDCFENFGKYVASVLRELPKQRAFHLKLKMVNLIADESCTKDEVE